MNPDSLRQALPRMWGALLARHGSPNEVQLQSAEPLLGGADVLICAPTASGKTEAYLGPMVERHCDRTEEVRLLLVSPTRALANDLHRRIKEPLEGAGFKVGRWTGDHHDRGRLQEITVLTPEGLDARLSRSRELLGTVRGIVLDELHVLDGNPRGDQLRILVRRLRRGQELQVVAASATVPSPLEMASRYMEDPRLVTVGRRRKLRARIAVAPGPMETLCELARCVDRGFRKILVFCDNRAEVEELAAFLGSQPPFSGAAFAHHGSLARQERLRVEEQFLSRSVAICVATSTLELGIDIGDIDLVALSGAPRDVAALLQRAGRGSRRARDNAVLCLAGSPFEERVFRAMLKAQVSGELLPAAYHFRAGVLVQQAISLLYENPAGWVSARALRSRLPPELAEVWSEERLDRILRRMAERGWLVSRGRRFVLGEKSERRWGRGVLHSNIAPSPEVAVTDMMTGDLIGMVARVGEGGIGLAGKGRRVLSAGVDRVVTREGFSVGLPSFGGGARAPVSSALARRVLEELEVPLPCLAGGPEVTLVHGLGSASGALLAAVFKAAGSKVARAGALALVLRAEPSSWPRPAEVRSALARNHDVLARGLGVGPWHGDLPPREQEQVVAGLVNLDGVREFLARGRPPSVDWQHAAWLAWW